MSMKIYYSLFNTLTKTGKIADCVLNSLRNLLDCLQSLFDCFLLLVLLIVIVLIIAAQLVVVVHHLHRSTGHPTNEPVSKCGNLNRTSMNKN